MKKKIMHLFTSNIYSGAENVAITIIDKFKDKYSFIYVCKEGKIEEILKKMNINYIALNTVNYISLKKIITHYKPDLIHAHGYTTSVLCSLICKNIPYISHLHNNKLWIKNLNIKSLLYLNAGKKAIQILTVSNSIKNEYIFSDKLKDKIINIGNTVSYEKIKEQITREHVEKKYDICCVARITKQKNPHKFIKIISLVKEKYPDIQAIWVGDGELKEDSIKYANSLGIKDNINFLGFKKNPYEYMNLSKLFVLTSDWEGYGLVAFEALSLGIPAIVSKVGGLPDIVDDSCGNLCITENEFVDSIVDLLKNDKKIKQKSSAAILKARKLDNTKIYFGILEKTYNKLLN